MTVSDTRDDLDQLQVLIVDDHVLFAQTLELALTRAGYVAGRVDLDEAPAGSAPLVRSVLERHPEVMLLDLDLGPAGDGFPLIEPSTRAGIAVVVVTATEEPGQWARAVMAGARKVIPKSGSLADVLGTVQRIEEGLPVMEPAERTELLDAWVARRAGNEERWQRFDQLTMRESEVLGLLMAGQSVREIARRGDTAEGTVRTQVKAVLAKLGVSSQLAAVGLAYRLGWRAPYQRDED
jgi:two-component system, NarL family, nitrate/nitrite response regulator NarL